MAFSLELVVDDILIRVFGMLPLRDVLSMRRVNNARVTPLPSALTRFPQTSKRLKAITHLRTIWHNQFCFEVLSKGLPIPGIAIPLQEISALDLEWRTRLAARVQKMWTRPVVPLRPVLHRGIPAAQQVALWTGGRELLTLHSGGFITWRLNKTNELAAENTTRRQSLRTGGAWKVYKNYGSLDTIAIANR
jgi:hypothetical protein